MIKTTNNTIIRWLGRATFVFIGLAALVQGGVFALGIRSNSFVPATREEVRITPIESVSLESIEANIEVIEVNSHSIYGFFHGLHFASMICNLIGLCLLDALLDQIKKNTTSRTVDLPQEQPGIAGSAS